MTVLLSAATAPSPFWFLTRSTGMIALVLLTLAVALGVANVRHDTVARAPRFVISLVHRNASLLAVTFVAIHVVTTMLDGYAPVSVVDIVIPFTSAYRPIWLGLGAAALDLLVAVTITSLLRVRLGQRAWRATHWLAYASWPLALVHGVGTGSDTRASWALAVTAACVAVVLGAVGLRVRAGWPAARRWRLTAAATAALFPVGVVVWLPAGPLADGWARRAGTPPALLASARIARPVAAAPGPQAAGAAVGSETSFTASATGRVTQRRLAGGRAAVEIALTIPGRQLDALEIRLVGTPVGGGIQMTSSRVTLGGGSDPRLYVGRVTSLQGAQIAMRVVGPVGTTLDLVAALQIAPGVTTTAGTVVVRPAPR